MKQSYLFSKQLDLTKIDEGVNPKIHAKVRRMLNSKAKISIILARSARNIVK